MAIDREHLRAYARRPWAALEAAKRDAMAAQYRADPAAHARAVEALTVHLRAVRPDWPTQAELAADLEAHVALKHKLDRAAAVWRERVR